MVCKKIYTILCSIILYSSLAFGMHNGKYLDCKYYENFAVYVVGSGSQEEQDSKKNKNIEDYCCLCLKFIKIIATDLQEKIFYKEDAPEYAPFLGMNESEEDLLRFFEGSSSDSSQEEQASGFSPKRSRNFKKFSDIYKEGQAKHTEYTEHTGLNEKVAKHIANERDENLEDFFAQHCTTGCHKNHGSRSKRIKICV